MTERRMVNPKVLLLVGAVVLVVSSAIAIFVAISYTPDSGSGVTSGTTSTAGVPAQR